MLKKTYREKGKNNFQRHVRNGITDFTPVHTLPVLASMSVQEANGLLIILLFSVAIFLFGLIALIMRLRQYRKRIIELTAVQNKTKQDESPTTDEITESSEKFNFLSRLNHEIRTPIYGLFGSLARFRIENPELSNLSAIDDIECQARQLYFQIGEMLDFVWLESKNTQLDKNNFNLKSELHHLLGYQKKIATEKGLGFIIDLPESLPESLFGDSFRLMQLLNKLLRRIADSMQKGTIHFRLHLTEIAESSFVLLQFEVKIEEENGSRKLKQSLKEGETDAKRLARNFIWGEPGFSAKMYERVLHEMNASVVVENVQSDELIFVVRVSLEKEREPQPVQNFQTGHILFVDDNLLNQRISAIVLRKMGYEVDLAENGLVAVNLFKTKKYDLILMDLQMPVMDGIEAVRLMREYEKQQHIEHPVRIMAMTANVMDSVRQKCIETGFNDFLPKPFDLEKLPLVLGNGFNLKNESADFH